MKWLAVFVALGSVVVGLVTLWWWALFGLRTEVCLAAALTVIVVGIPAFIAWMNEYVDA